jgi:hypothetical protein
MRNFQSGAKKQINVSVVPLTLMSPFNDNNKKIGVSPSGNESSVVTCSPRVVISPLPHSTYLNLQDIKSKKPSNIEIIRLNEKETSLDTSLKTPIPFNLNQLLKTSREDATPRKKKKKKKLKNSLSPSNSPCSEASDLVSDIQQVALSSQITKRKSQKGNKILNDYQFSDRNKYKII